MLASHFVELVYCCFRHRGLFQRGLYHCQAVAAAADAVPPLCVRGGAGAVAVPATTTAHRDRRRTCCYCRSVVVARPGG